MQHTSRVSPCYPYRYKEEGESDASYAERLATELEEEICRVGKGKVAAFFAETGKSCPTASGRVSVDGVMQSEGQRRAI